MRVNAINMAYYHPQAGKNLKNDNTVAVPETSVNFSGKTASAGAKAFGVVGGIIGFFVAGPIGAAIGAGIGAGTGAGYGSIDDYNKKHNTDINMLEDWDHDTKY